MIAEAFKQMAAAIAALDCSRNLPSGSCELVPALPHQTAAGLAIDMDIAGNVAPRAPGHRGADHTPGVRHDPAGPGQADIQHRAPVNAPVAGGRFYAEPLAYARCQAAPAGHADQIAQTHSAPVLGAGFEDPVAGIEFQAFAPDGSSQ